MKNLKNPKLATKKLSADDLNNITGGAGTQTGCGNGSSGELIV